MPHQAADAVADAEREPGLDEVEAEVEDGLEEEGSDQRDGGEHQELAFRIDAHLAGPFEGTGEVGVVVDEVRLNHETDDGNDCRQPEDFDEAVDEDTNEHEASAAVLMGRHQLPDPLEDALVVTKGSKRRSFKSAGIPSPLSLRESSA